MRENKTFQENSHPNLSDQPVNALHELFCSRGKINTKLSPIIYSTFGTRLTTLTLKGSKDDLLAILSNIFGGEFHTYTSAHEMEIILRIGMKFNFNALLEIVNESLKSCPPNKRRKKLLHSTLILLSIVTLYSEGWKDFNKEELQNLCLRVRNFYDSGQMLTTIARPTERQRIEANIPTTPQKNKRKFPSENITGQVREQKRLPPRLKQTLFSSPPLTSSKADEMASPLPTAHHSDTLEEKLLSMAEEFLIYKGPASSTPQQQDLLINPFSSTSYTYSKSQSFFQPKDVQFPSRIKTEDSQPELTPTPKARRIQN